MFCVNRYLFTMFVIKLFLSYQDEDREHDPVQRQEASLEEDQAEAVDERFKQSSSSWRGSDCQPWTPRPGSICPDFIV